MKKWNERTPNQRVMLVFGGLFLIWLLVNDLGGPDNDSTTRSQVPARVLSTVDAPPVEECTRHVVYHFGGSARTVSLTYENATGGTEQIDKRANGSTIDLGEMECGAFVYISAQNYGDTGEVVCRITADQTTIQEASSSGAYVIATCSGSVE